MASSCPCVCPLLITLKLLTDFRETWYQHHVTRCYLTFIDLLLISYNHYYQHGGCTNF
jgi:hypothetical protein